MKDTVDHLFSDAEAKHVRPDGAAQVLVTVIRGTGSHVIPCSTEESVLDALRRERLYAGSTCGGTGKCGKCRVRFLTGAPPAGYSDRGHFSPAELNDGLRLACRAFPKENCTINMDFPDESGYAVLADTSLEGYFPGGEEAKASAADLREEDYAVAIDIGTTTIAAALAGLTSKRVKACCTTLNRQRMYGADVISRIQASTDGKKDELRQLIREDLLLCIKNLVEENCIDKNRIMKLILAGNTTMGHLLRGYPCVTLGASPFTPFYIGKEECSFSEMLGSDYLSCSAVLFPGISAFVGGDIVSGLLACGFASSEETNLFIDLGTNGEMAVGNKDGILAASAAAGPAFEGGNIAWGTGSIPGAISSVSIDGNTVHTETIGNRPPVGICGTGIIEVMDALRENGLIDETGLLDEKYFQTGFPLARTAGGETILITQKDIREIQLAKSAVRAGIEVLLSRCGVDYGDIGEVWLAGGFGVNIDRKKAIGIGMIPGEFSGKIHAVGNTALRGAILYSLDGNAAGRTAQIVKNSSEIRLAEDRDFNRLYVEHMLF